MITRRMKFGRRGFVMVLVALVIILMIELLLKAYADDMPPPAMTEEMRAIGLARLRVAMLAYPPAGVFIDTSAVPPYVLTVPPEQDKK